MSERLTVQNRVSATALAVANVGAGVYVGSDDAVLAAGGWSWVFGLVMILLALPAGIAAVLGNRSRFLDEGLFVNGIAWVFTTALFLQAHAGSLASGGLATILLAATLATFSLWLGFSRQEAAADVT